MLRNEFEKVDPQVTAYPRFKPTVHFLQNPELTRDLGRNLRTSFNFRGLLSSTARMGVLGALIYCGFLIAAANHLSSYGHVAWNAFLFYLALAGYLTAYASRPVALLGIKRKPKSYLSLSTIGASLIAASPLLVFLAISAALTALHLNNAYGDLIIAAMGLFAFSSLCLLPILTELEQISVARAIGRLRSITSGKTAAVAVYLAVSNLFGIMGISFFLVPGILFSEWNSRNIASLYRRLTEADPTAGT